jgi:GTP-binding protein
MSAFAHACFLRAAGRGADLPAPGPLEIAFAGRSNVGKSSAINALAGRAGLARTSRTPGRTQTINFYDLGEDARLVDLPGYGYARVPREMRTQWRSLVGAYFSAPRALAAVVLVMDARHPLTPLDVQFVAWLGENAAAPRLLALLTKADKLSRAAQQDALRAVRQRLVAGDAALFSSATRQGVDECRDLLGGWLAAGRKNKKPPVKGK